MKTILLMAYAMIFSIGAVAGEPLQTAAIPNDCARPDAPPTRITWEKKDTGGYEIAAQVLCCCSTWNGGSCCNYVYFCGGFVPGCMCQ